MGQQRSPDFRLHTRKELEERLKVYHGSWRLASLVLRCLLKMGHVVGMAYFSIVIPYMILWEWQLHLFFRNNLFYRTCVEKAYDWRMKSQISSWPAGERGSMIYWRHFKLPLKDVLSLSSLQITLRYQIHHFCDASQAAYGAVSDLCLVDMLG